MGWFGVIPSIIVAGATLAAFGTALFAAGKRDCIVGGIVAGAALVVVGGLWTIVGVIA